MGSSKLSQIHKDSKNNEIKVCDLKVANINTNDIYNVKELAKTLYKKFVFTSIFVFLFFILISYLFYDTIKTSTSIFTKDFFLMLFIFLMISWLLLYLFNQVYSFKSCSYKRAQYGIVKTKYTFKNSSETTTKIDYYINVEFPNDNTYIRKVICTDKIYDSLTTGSNVLVISFDDKKLYAIPTTS